MRRGFPSLILLGETSSNVAKRWSYWWNNLDSYSGRYRPSPRTKTLPCSSQPSLSSWERVRNSLESVGHVEEALLEGHLPGVLFGFRPAGFSPQHSRLVVHFPGDVHVAAAAENRAVPSVWAEEGEVCGIEGVVPVQIVEVRYFVGEKHKIAFGHGVLLPAEGQQTKLVTTMNVREDGLAVFEVVEGDYGPIVNQVGEKVPRWCSRWRYRWGRSSPCGLSGDVALRINSANTA